MGIVHHFQEGSNMHNNIKLTIVLLLLISIVDGSTDSTSTGLSPIPLDLKVNPANDTTDNSAPIQTNIKVAVFDAVTNRRHPLFKNASLQQIVNDDVAPASKPNIILILADNVGYMDPGCYGGGAVVGAPTPRLDQMAKEGLRMTSYYSETQCTPTRAAMMTGRLPIRTGMNQATAPGLNAGLSPNEVTLAKVLSDAGYKTAMFGKWHLGDINESEPQNMGFDEYFGQLYHLNAYSQKERIGYDPESEIGNPIYGLVEAKKGENLRVVAPLNMTSIAFVDEQVTDKAIEYIKNQSNSTDPFFVYLSFARTHFPSVQNPKWAGKSSKGPYGDGMMEMDSYVGDVLDVLKKTGQAKDTLVVFVSDNGPTLDQWPDSGYSPFRGMIGTAYEGGVRVPGIFWWPGTIETGRTSNEIMCAVDLFNTFAALGGGEVPTDRPIDGIDQSNFLLGIQNESSRSGAIWFMGSESAYPHAVRWHQFKIFDRAYDSMAGPVSEYGQSPAVYNIEMDPGEQHNIAGEHDFVLNAFTKISREYAASLAEFPNTPSRAYPLTSGD